MNEESYPFHPPRVDFRYEFTSVSVEKQVRKVVRFISTGVENVYNLALLDVLPDGTTSDMSETNNKDMTKVMATVMQITIDFFANNPDSFILVQGSDARRQRLYQIIINRELKEIQKGFNVLGGSGTEVERFRSDQAYEFFIVFKII